MRIGGLQRCSLIDFPGQMAAIIFTIGCNFRCPYCHNPELVDETAAEIPMADVLAFLRTRVGKLDGVVITGGEPTLHDDLIPFIKDIKALGFKVKLDSNGTNPDVVAKIFSAGLIDYIAMDIKAPFHKYESGIGRPVNIEAIKRTVELIKASGVPYEFRTTVVKALLSPADIEQIGKDIAGAEHYYLQRFIPTKLLNPAFLRKTTYTDEEFAGFRNNLLQYVKCCSIR